MVDLGSDPDGPSGEEQLEDLFKDVLRNFRNSPDVEKLLDNDDAPDSEILSLILGDSEADHEEARNKMMSNMLTQLDTLIVALLYRSMIEERFDVGKGRAEELLQLFLAARENHLSDVADLFGPGPVDWEIGEMGPGVDG